jgi:type IV secretory pathway VirB10-like protein
MDVLINLIITIAIIIFVLKRMAEVAKKGGDITGPPPPPSMIPEEEEEREASTMRRRMAPAPRERSGEYEIPGEEETISGQEQMARSRKIQERLQEARRRFEQQRRQIEEQRQTSEEQFESARETAHIAEYREPSPIAHMAPQTAGRERREQRGAQGIPAILFNRSILVQGILMSEILGPPVGLRKQTPW